MLYVRERLHCGLQPDEDGYYCISRKDFVNDIPMSASNFDRVKEEWMNYDLANYSIDCALGFKFKLPNEDHMFLDIKYEKGFVKFKRNPITLLPEVERLWTGSAGGWNIVHSIYQYEPPLALPDDFEWPEKYR